MLYNRAARPRRPAPTRPAAPTALVGAAKPALLAEAVADAAMLVAEPVAEATTLPALLPMEDMDEASEDMTELARLSAELKADEPAVLALDRRLLRLESMLEARELSAEAMDEA